MASSLKAVARWVTPLQKALGAVPDRHCNGAICDAAHEARARGRLTENEWERIVEIATGADVRIAEGK